MRGPIAATLLTVAPAGASEISDRTSELAACAEGLARTLEVMEAKPLMKEEEATGLMWLRLDASVALDHGDVATCLEKLAAVERVLGIE